jgi:hypothetical protein
MQCGRGLTPSQDPNVARRPRRLSFEHNHGVKRPAACSTRTALAHFLPSVRAGQSLGGRLGHLNAFIHGKPVPAHRHVPRCSHSLIPHAHAPQRPSRRARARAFVAVGKGLWWTDGRPLLPLVRRCEPLAALLRGRKPPFRGAHRSMCSLCSWHAVRPRLGPLGSSPDPNVPRRPRRPSFEHNHCVELPAA